jgi:CBS domain containing-hemolysin-like protein
MVNARLEIDYLNENYQWQLPEGDYDTLGGYILSINGNIPKQGEQIETPDYTFSIVSMRDVRIDKVKITFKNPSELSGQIRPVL